MPLVQQHRRGPGRIHGEELLAPFPRGFLDQGRIQPIFTEREAHEPGMGAEGMMEQREHVQGFAAVHFRDFWFPEG